MAAQFPRGGALLLAGHAARHCRERGCRSVFHGRHHVVPHHAGEPAHRHPQSDPGRTRADVHAGGTHDGGREAVDRIQHQFRRRHGYRCHRPVRVRERLPAPGLSRRQGQAGGLLQQEGHRECALAHVGLGAFARPQRALTAEMLLPDVLIIDATDRLGWLAGRLLPDPGAEVIKIEARGSDRSSSQWRACNVNKRVLELEPEGAAEQEHLEELIQGADICLLTPRSSALSPRLDPAVLRKDCPRLVFVAITPFGREGPRSHWKGSDPEIMAAGGAMALAGEPDGMPMRVSEPQSYGWAGAEAAHGALIALYRRDASGRGDLVEVSGQACVVTALSHAPAFVDLNGIEPTRAGGFITGRSIKGARYRVFWPCRDGYINFIFYGGVAGRRTNEQLVALMRECGAELGALAAIDWKVWDPTKADQSEVDAIEAPVGKFFARLSKREFLTEGHRREMLGYPVSTVADIASDPQLEARGFFQAVAGVAERFCGSFAVIDGARPALRHAPGAPLAAVKSTQGEPAMAEPPRRA